MSKKTEKQGPVPVSAVLPEQRADRLVDGVPVRTYRGASLAALAPQISAELGESAMIVRQREGVTGGFAGFFAKRCVEVDVAILHVPGRPSPGRTTSFDAVDGPAVGPELPGPYQATESFPSVAARSSYAVSQPTAAQTAAVAAALGREPSDVEPETPVSGVPLSAVIPEIKASAPPAAAPAYPAAQPPLTAALPFVPPTPPPAPLLEEPPFSAGRGGAEPAPIVQPTRSFEEHLRTAGLADPRALLTGDPAAQLAPLRAALIHRGLPEQISGPVTDDTLRHRVALEPERPVHELLASELARRIPTAPLAGRSGQAVAFVGSSGAGKTRAIARLAAAYGAAMHVPVACVTLQDSGNDALLATALAPFGIAVHAAPDAPRALDRITALRQNALVLVDTPGVSPGDRDAVDRLGATLELLELDAVALCLPVVLAAPIARRVLRAMRPLAPTLLVATHADEADLLGGVVAVAIDRRVPLAYVSAGAGRGAITGADAHAIATQLVGPPAAPTLEQRRAAERILASVPPRAEVPGPSAVVAAAVRPMGPTIDIAAGPNHLAAPWVVSPKHEPDPGPR